MDAERNTSAAPVKKRRRDLMAAARARQADLAAEAQASGRGPPPATAPSHKQLPGVGRPNIAPAGQADGSLGATSIGAEASGASHRESSDGMSSG
eukprot:CAMPEP_0117684338 /NCGR_PEP_ID=MMETSP0804-20121206/21024_1 /TAXON_ID=1074897 /ORGANISM="Tetraselmis astigmatica, Strain CCMP880" /LENGTH=94 /DNA_ID=CAMNT_0005495279 /DNA_START=1 /DNA_END=282 /DNA_ORIENTATION=+